MAHQYATLIQFREKEYKKTHYLYALPPSQWAAERGATHSLWLGEGLGRGTRPVILKKTRILVGVDETIGGGGIEWETWEGRFQGEWPECPVPFTPF
jgi:hypothetical protein